MAIQEASVRIPLANIRLDGNLRIPSDAKGIVLFAHGSGSSRLSPRNRYVAEVLNEAGFATLLMDLLTPNEEADDLLTAHLRFNIPMLAGRVVNATDWLADQPSTRDLAVGYFGASTGAAAALVAAAAKPKIICAVVSRGGRPDLAGESLAHVQAPSLLIVGGNDPVVIELNQEAMAQMHVETKLEIVPGATHLFEEQGALEQVAALARNWIERYVNQIHQSARISKHERGTSHHTRSAKR